MLVKYETWRRKEREYNFPWIKLKREVFNERGLKFPKYSPDKTSIERELEKTRIERKFNKTRIKRKFE